LKRSFWDTLGEGRLLCSARSSLGKGGVLMNLKSGQKHTNTASLSTPPISFQKDRFPGPLPHCGEGPGKGFPPWKGGSGGMVKKREKGSKGKQPLRFFPLKEGDILKRCTLFREGNVWKGVHPVRLDGACDVRDWEGRLAESERGLVCGTEEDTSLMTGADKRIVTAFVERRSAELRGVSGSFTEFRGGRAKPHRNRPLRGGMGFGMSRPGGMEGYGWLFLGGFFAEFAAQCHRFGFFLG